MKISTKTLGLFAASCFALVSFSFAQPQTFTTEPAYTGSTFTFGGGATQGETFSTVYSVASMTYDFFAGSSGGGVVNSATTLSATFGQWTGSSFIAGTTVSFNSLIIPPSALWTATVGSSPSYRVTFDLTNTGTNPIPTSFLSTIASSDVSLDSISGYLTNPGSTYALMLTNTGAASNLALGLTNSDAFAGGAAYPLGVFDWTFAQIAVTTQAPIPESSTIAAILGCVLVAGLVGFRLRQQRQLALAPAAQTLA